MKQKAFFIIFEGLSLKQIKKIFFERWESDFKLKDVYTYNSTQRVLFRGKLHLDLNQLVFQYLHFIWLNSKTKRKLGVVKHVRLHWNSCLWNYYDMYEFCKNTELPEEKNSI